MAGTVPDMGSKVSAFGLLPSGRIQLLWSKLNANGVFSWLESATTSRFLVPVRTLPKFTDDTSNCTAGSTTVPANRNGTEMLCSSILKS